MPDKAGLSFCCFGLALIWSNGGSEPRLLLSSAVRLMSSSPGGHYICILTASECPNKHKHTHTHTHMHAHARTQEAYHADRVLLLKGLADVGIKWAELQYWNPEIKYLGHVLRRRSMSFIPCETAAVVEHVPSLRRTCFLSLAWLMTFTESVADRMHKPFLDLKTVLTSALALGHGLSTWM